MIDRSKIVPSLAQACRSRSITHLLLSEYTYDLYRTLIKTADRKVGIRYSTVHGVALLPCQRIPAHLLVGFRVDQPDGKLLLRAVQSEQYDSVQRIAELMIDKNRATLSIIPGEQNT